MRVCLNCHFYQPSAHWECHETIPERVAEKDRSNFCDYFRPRQHKAPAAGEPASGSDTARDDFNRLFGG